MTPGHLPPAPKVTLNHSTISASELYFTGVQSSGSGFPANRPVQIVLDRSGFIWGTAQADAHGNFFYLLKQDTNPKSSSMHFGLAFTSGSLYTFASMTVSPSFAAKVTPKAVTTDVLGTDGVTVHGSYFPHDAKVTVTFDGKDPKVYTVNSHRDFSLLFKRVGVVPGKHTIGLSWLPWMPPGLGPADDLGYNHLDLVLKVTGSAVKPAAQTPAALASPEIFPAASTGQLANSGGNATPLLLGLALIVAGTATVLLSRCRQSQQS